MEDERDVKDIHVTIIYAKLFRYQNQKYQAILIQWYIATTAFPSGGLGYLQPLRGENGVGTDLLAYWDK